MKTIDLNAMERLVNIMSLQNLQQRSNKLSQQYLYSAVGYVVCCVASINLSSKYCVTTVFLGKKNES